MKNILVLEPGSWGTALGILLSRKNNVCFWYKDPILASKIFQKRENEKLPKVKIPQKIHISSDLKDLLKNIDLIIIASPSFSLREILSCLKGFSDLPPLLGIAKGVEKDTLKFPSQIVEEVLGKIPYGHLSGPGFAKEVVRGRLAQEVIATRDKKFLKELKELFQIRSLEIKTTHDLIGAQLAGAMKNSLAIGISLAEATLTKSDIAKLRPKLISLGLKEMISIGVAIGGEKETFLGPAGRDDLILTATNSLSRNFQCGKNLYLDATKMRKDIEQRKITVEGFDSVFALYKLAEKYQINLPIIEETYKVVYEKNSPKQAIENMIKIAVTYENNYLEC